MTITLQHVPGRFRLVPTPAEPVFVADMPGPAAASGTAHLGPATLVSWLEPMLASPPLAQIRLPCGAAKVVAARCIYPAENLATRRILPARRGAPWAAKAPA